MNTTTNKQRIYVAAAIFLFAAYGLQARGHCSRPRDIDRALLITDMVLRTLIPTQTVIVEPQPVVTYTTPVYETTTVVTTPTTVITPVYSRSVYVAPTIHYTRPAWHYYHRPAPRYYHPPRHHHRHHRHTPHHAPRGGGRSHHAPRGGGRSHHRR